MQHGAQSALSELSEIPLELNDERPDFSNIPKYCPLGRFFGIVNETPAWSMAKM